MLAKRQPKVRHVDPDFELVTFVHAGGSPNAVGQPLIVEAIDRTLGYCLMNDYHQLLEE